MPEGGVIAKSIMRVLAKAGYSPGNIGHFGLALDRYAHFTSPIRRYADLLVHRSLVEAFNLGAGGLPPDQKEQLLDMADHITDTEVCSAKAERSTRDRLVAAFLSTQIGDRFLGRVVAINDAGAYVALKGMGADGFLLKREMAERGRACRIGEPLEVILKEADGLSGNIMVSLANGKKPIAHYRRRA